ncbi:hypothetical protein ABZ805_22015 [Saccharopolyspora sp. NPDC047091]|uniref:hypothetical protein n=1 Tax=Saccharopolyspora sp. NPDC047091 TaxID=3155924 RepID=UPI003403F216
MRHSRVVSGSAVLLTAFAEVLGQWSARPDPTLDRTFFDRREVRPDVQRVLGDFTSLLLGVRSPVSLGARGPYPLVS